MNIDSSSPGDFANSYKVAMVLDTAYSNIDRMTDTVIEKSQLYTITKRPQSLSIIGPHTFRAPAQSSVVTIEYCLVILPNHLSIDQVRTLSDVSALGGKIIDCRGKSEYMRVPW